MRATRIEAFGGPEQLIVRDLPDPPVGPGQVKIAVKAAGVNFADIMMRMGLYPEAPPRPFTPGYEVAGEVAEVGAGATRYKPGDRVMAGTRFGGYASVVVAQEGKVLPLPGSFTYAEGAAIPVNYITAWVAMHSMARIGRGEKVLIHTAAGGVGLAAVQLARRQECTIFGTAGSADKLRFLADHGVAHPINYREQDFVAEVLRATNGRGVDLILDPVGGKNVKRGMQCLATCGRIVMFGASTLVGGARRSLKELASFVWNLPRFNAVGMMHGNKGVFGLNALKFWDQEEVLGPVVAGMSAGVAEGWLRARVDKTFALEKAGDAHAYIQDRRNIGKVVLEV